MDFFYQASGTINTSTPLGQWDVGGYREVAVHLWFQGAGGAKVFPTLSYNNLTAANEELTLGPAPAPGGSGTAILAKVYPIFAPTLAIVLYNPGASMAYQLRLYATCCETGFSLKLPFGKRKRTISGTADLASLDPVSR